MDVQRHAKMRFIIARFTARYKKMTKSLAMTRALGDFDYIG